MRKRSLAEKTQARQPPTKFEATAPQISCLTATGAYGLAARFVYVFRGVSEKERPGGKDTGQTAVDKV